jgi:uncharacterized protein YfeS
MNLTKLQSLVAGELDLYSERNDIADTPLSELPDRSRVQITKMIYTQFSVLGINLDDTQRKEFLGLVFNQDIHSANDMTFGQAYIWSKCANVLSTDLKELADKKYGHKNRRHSQ